MIVMTREPEAQTNLLLRDFLSLETPEGYRAELVDGEIIVTPPPGGNHERCIARIMKQLHTRSSVAMECSAQKGLIVPGAAGQNMVIPDITVVPEKLDLFHDAPSWMPTAGVAMVVEITSSSPDRDRNPKRRSYAAARIPLYLLVDRQERRVILFSEPARDEYVSTSSVPLGDSLKLPEPFSFTLETDSFAD
jgi:Uma2 family endonuclease